MREIPIITQMSGSELRRLRIDAGFDTTAEAAKIIGIRELTWYRWECGKVKIGHPSLLYWALLGYKLRAQSMVVMQANALPNLPEYEKLNQAQVA